MEKIYFAVFALAAFLFAAVNPSILVSRLVYGRDIRNEGSGNPGFTNFKRVFGNRLAWFVWAMDLSKGVILSLLARKFFAKFGLSQVGVAWTGFFAMLGHSYPVWYGFKGGKGFSVGAATIFFIDWRVGLVAAAAMMILLFTIRFMSLAVICAGIVCPVALVFFGAESVWTIVFCAISVAFMIFRHSPNIKKLIAGTESKFYLKSKRPPKN